MSESGEQADFLDDHGRRQPRAPGRARAAAQRRRAAWRAPPIPPVPPQLQLSARRFDLIAEVKLRSPAAGNLRKGGEAMSRARVGGYAEAGAACVSVLTEPSRFDGSLAHLQPAVRALGRPHAGHAQGFSRRSLPGRWRRGWRRRRRAADPAHAATTRRSRRCSSARCGSSCSCCSRLRCRRHRRGPRRWSSAYASRRPAAGGRQLPRSRRRSRSSRRVSKRCVRCCPPTCRASPRAASTTAADAARVRDLGYDVALVGSALMTALEPLQLVRAMLSAGRDERARRS